MFAGRRGEAFIRKAGDNACQGRLLQTIMPQQGRGDTITPAQPEGPYLHIFQKLRHEPNQPGEFGEWIEDASLHNPLPHL